MHIFEDRFEISGEKFYERRWTIPEPKGHIAIVHGFGEHCARYDYTAETFNRAGYSVYSYDQRWHGRSPGTIGHIDDFDVLPQELTAFLNHVRPETSSAPLFLFAHSMGALVTTRLMQTDGLPDDVRGVVLSSGLLDVPDNVSPALVQVADLLGRFAPMLPVAGLNAEKFSRDRELVADAKEDPLNFHGFVRARTGAQLNRGISAVRANLGAITVPIWVGHGDADELAPVAGSQYLFEHASSPDKELKVYPGGYHELMNDTIKDEFLAAVVAWYDARV